MKTTVGALLAAAAIIVSGASASELSDAANSLAPGQSIKISTNGYWAAVMTSSCGTTPNHSYGQSGVWDPVRNEARFIGKGPGDCDFDFVVYSETTNTWSNNRTLHGGIAGVQRGHMYDHNAINPVTGDQYFKRFNSPYLIYKWTSSTQAWSQPTSIPAPIQTGAPAEGLTFFPDLGLVFTDERGCRYWDLASRWRNCTGDTPFTQSGDSYHTFSEWQPNANLMIFGGGNNSSNEIYKLSSTGVVTRMGNSPVALGNSPSQGLLIADPASDVFVAMNRSSSSSRWREYDPTTDSWRTLPIAGGSCASPCNGTPNFSVNTSWGANVGIPIPEYGVIMYLCSVGDCQSGAVWLYKHSDGGGNEVQIPPTPASLAAN